MRKHLKGYIFLFTIAGIVIILDQWTKYLVRTNLEIGERWAPWHWLLPYARVIHWRNTGAAFGIFQNWGDIFMVLAIIVSIGIIVYYPRVPAGHWPLRVAMGLQLGGAIGNLIDRLTLGHVTDYISVFNFAVFNIADACITLGVGVLILGMWIEDRKAKRLSTLSSPEHPPDIEGDGLIEEGRGE